MSREWKHLNLRAVEAIHAEVLAVHGGAPGLRDLALLESAIAAPQATWSGDPIMVDGIEIAASYLFYICGNHAFVDGNKRTALAACLVFLLENGLMSICELPVDEWEQLIFDVAGSRIDRAQTTARLRKLLKAL